MPFFTEEVMQRIRYLHYKIKKIEEALDKEEESFSLDDLNLVLEYTKILNINYQNEDQVKLLKALDITPNFLEPLENNREIQINDLMFECARTLWVMARAYSHLSEKYEVNEEWEDSIIAMVECSKIFKTGAYFSAASINQHDLGITLSSENLELNSEEARILAQGVAALKEENSNNTYFASKLYAGLSSLSKRLFYLKKHDEKRKQQLRAQFHFDMGKACQLKAQASLESSITNINKDKVMKLQQKANFYYLKSEEIWSEMISSLSELSNEEKSSIEQNISIVKDMLKEKNLDLLDYEEIKRIQDPEPIIIIPENLAPFVPKSTIYLTKFVPKDLNIKRFKSFQKKKLEQKIPYSKRERLNTKLNMIDTAIEKLAHLTK
ncbi:MAG: hypothetical protein ACTSPZ_03285 [Promethearchaeota archaeon]